MLFKEKDSNTQSKYVNNIDIPEIYKKFDRRRMRDEELSKGAVLENIAEIFQNATEAETQALFLAWQVMTSEPLPEEPPELFADRPAQGSKREHVLDFIKRVYGPFLGRGLSKSDLRKLDPQLYRAYWNFVSRNGEPEGLILPGKPAKQDSLFEQVPEDARTDVLSLFSKLRPAASAAEYRLKR